MLLQVDQAPPGVGRILPYGSFGAIHVVAVRRHIDAGMWGLPSPRDAHMVSLVFPVGALTLYTVGGNFHTLCSKKRVQNLLVLAASEPDRVSF